MRLPHQFRTYVTPWKNTTSSPDLDLTQRSRSSFAQAPQQSGARVANNLGLEGRGTTSKIFGCAIDFFKAKGLRLVQITDRMVGYV